MGPTVVAAGLGVAVGLAVTVVLIGAALLLVCAVTWLRRGTPRDGTTAWWKRVREDLHMERGDLARRSRRAKQGRRQGGGQETTEREDGQSQ